MSIADSTEALAALGFTELEAGVYSVLVESSPATAYRVAQQLGKPTANVYKAVASLERKGAVIVDGGENRLCRAVSPKELLLQVEEQFSSAKDRAQQALSQLQEPRDDDERIYQLRTRKQVISRALAMIKGARQLVLCDVFPDLVAEVHPHLVRACDRGVRVGIQLYRPAEIDPRIHAYLKPNGSEIVQRWPGQWFNLVADAREHLLAFLGSGGDEVHQAVWSESTYLSVLYCSGLVGELVMTAMGTAIQNREGPESFRRAYARALELLGVSTLPGYVALAERFGAQPKKATASSDSSSRPRLAPRRRSRGRAGSMQR
jgi:sugar-specific transcriptional regulator TrmB